MPETTEQDPAQVTPPAAQDKTPDPVPYSRFQEVNDKANKLAERLQAIENEQQEKTKKELQAQNDFKTLYESLQSELKTEKVNNLKLRVASSKGLPAELVDRLRGETEEDLTKDADSLLAFVKVTTQDKGVPPPPKGGSNTAFDFSNASPQAIRDYIAKQNQS